MEAGLCPGSEALRYLFLLDWRRAAFVRLCEASIHVELDREDGCS